MRPREGKLLGPERHNPKLKTFYEELVLLDPKFKDAYKSYLTSRAISTSQIGITGLHNYVNNRFLVPRNTYQEFASTVGLNPEVEPCNVTGVYPSRLLAYFFDSLDISMKDAVKRLVPEFMKADRRIAHREIHAVKCGIRDILTCRSGLIPYQLLKAYEDELVKLLGVDGITREELRETFRDDINNLEARLNELVGKAKRRNPKPYEFNINYPTKHDYVVGDVLRHLDFGLGKVEAIEPVENESKLARPPSYIITVRFDGRTRKLLVNKRPYQISQELTKFPFI